MRYHTKVGAVRAVTWITYVVVVTADLAGRRLPLWLALSAGILTSLSFLPNYQCSYWDILPDRLVEQRLFRRSVLMFVEIVALSPTSIAGSEEDPEPELVQVRGVAGRRMLVETPNAREFLKELLDHLPPLPPLIPE
jgi:hypothetical protein